VIGEGKNAERIKIEARHGAGTDKRQAVEIHIKGRDLKQGRLKTVVRGRRTWRRRSAGRSADGDILFDLSYYPGRALEEPAPQDRRRIDGPRHRAERAAAAMLRPATRRQQRLGVSEWCPRASTAS